MGGRGSSSLSAMQKGAIGMIRSLESRIESEKKKLGVAKGSGINTFISTSTQQMEAKRAIRNAENSIDSLKRRYKVL